jgi:hypothetical protein
MSTNRESNQGHGGRAHDRHDRDEWLQDYRESLERKAYLEGRRWAEDHAGETIAAFLAATGWTYKYFGQLVTEKIYHLTGEQVWDLYGEKDVARRLLSTGPSRALRTALEVTAAAEVLSGRDPRGVLLIKLSSEHYTIAGFLPEIFQVPEPNLEPCLGVLLGCEGPNPGRLARLPKADAQQRVEAAKEKFQAALLTFFVELASKMKRYGT